MWNVRHIEAYFDIPLGVAEGATCDIGIDMAKQVGCGTPGFLWSLGSREVMGS